MKIVWNVHVCNCLHVHNIHLNSLIAKYIHTQVRKKNIRGKIRHLFIRTLNVYAWIFPIFRAVICIFFQTGNKIFENKFRIPIKNGHTSVTNKIIRLALLHFQQWFKKTRKKSSVEIKFLWSILCSIITIYATATILFRETDTLFFIILAFYCVRWCGWFSNEIYPTLSNGKSCVAVFQFFAL